MAKINEQMLLTAQEQDKTWPQNGEKQANIQGYKTKNNNNNYYKNKIRNK